MGLKPARTVDLGTVMIDVSADDDLSSVMDFSGWRGRASAIMIEGPGTLTATARVQASLDNSTWSDLQSNGADITIPADGMVRINAVDFNYLRIATSGAEGADRTFTIRGVEPQS